MFPNMMKYFSYFGISLQVKCYQCKCTYLNSSVFFYWQYFLFFFLSGEKNMLDMDFKHCSNNNKNNYLFYVLTSYELKFAETQKKN